MASTIGLQSHAGTMLLPARPTCSLLTVPARPVCTACHPMALTICLLSHAGATLLSFLAALLHFTTELFIYKTMSIKGAMSPFIVASALRAASLIDQTCNAVALSCSG